MKLLRFVLVLAVVAYAGWLAWPIISPFLEGASPESASARAGATVMTDNGGGLMQAGLWIGAVVLYLIAALLLGSGNPRAAVAYFLGFIADAVLRLALNGGNPFDMSGGSANQNSDIAARSAEAMPMDVGGIDPTWLILGVLAVIGVLIVIASQRRRRHRTPGQFDH